MTKITSLRIQPIKACGVAETDAVSVTLRGLADGLVGDRRLALIDDLNVVITQRRGGHSGLKGEFGHPELTLVKMGLLYDAGVASQIRASFDGHGSINIDPQRASDERVGVILHGKTVPVHLVKGEADKWFSQILGRNVRLVNQMDDDLRRADPVFSVDPNNKLNLGDGYQILLASMASLRGLKADTSRSWDLDVFRPGVVVDGDTLVDHEENSWGRFKVGPVTLLGVKPCTRCEVTTIDLKTGKLPEGAITQSEPWASLNKRWNVRYKVGTSLVSGPVFGENCEPVRSALGVIRVGDDVVVERTKPAPQWVRRSAPKVG